MTKEITLPDLHGSISQLAREVASGARFVVVRRTPQGQTKPLFQIARVEAPQPELTAAADRPAQADGVRHLTSGGKAAALLAKL